MLSRHPLSTAPLPGMFHVNPVTRLCGVLAPSDRDPVPDRSCPPDRPSVFRATHANGCSPPKLTGWSQAVLAPDSRTQSVENRTSPSRYILLSTIRSRDQVETHEACPGQLRRTVIRLRMS